MHGVLQMDALVLSGGFIQCLFHQEVLIGLEDVKTFRAKVKKKRNVPKIQKYS